MVFQIQVPISLVTLVIGIHANISSTSSDQESSITYIHVYTHVKLTVVMLPYCFFQWISCSSSPCSKILKTLQTQKSPNEQHKIGCISTMTMNQSTRPISLKRGMIEAYNLTSNTISRVTPILTGGLEYSRIFRFYTLHRTPLQVNTIRLNKKYSRYNGTEVIQRVLSPSKSSKYTYMFKNSELRQKTGHHR